MRFASSVHHFACAIHMTHTRMWKSALPHSSLRCRISSSSIIRVDFTLLFVWLHQSTGCLPRREQQVKDSSKSSHCTVCRMTSLTSRCQTLPVCVSLLRWRIQATSISEDGSWRPADGDRRRRIPSCWSLHLGGSAETLQQEWPVAGYR